MKLPLQCPSVTLSVSLVLPYTDPIDWDRFQERVRAAAADCRAAPAAGQSRRRPRFEVVLKPVGVPTVSLVVLNNLRRGREMPGFHASICASRQMAGLGLEMSRTCPNEPASLFLYWACPAKIWHFAIYLIDIGEG